MNPEIQNDEMMEQETPANSTANLYPFSYSGKTDPNGVYLGIDVSGTNIIVSFDRRARDKTNGHILILGNSGEGKSHLLNVSEMEMQDFDGKNTRSYWR